MTTEFMTYDKFMSRLDALAKKFPMKDGRKQDIADAKALASACEDTASDDFEDLVEVMDEVVRLKNRYAANLKLVEAANKIGVESVRGPNAIEAVRAMYKITDAKRSKKSDEEKAKEVSGLLKKQISSASKSGARWAKLSQECAAQADAIIKVDVQLKKARKALSAALKKAPGDAVHKQMGEIILGHLETIDADLGKTYGDYWSLETMLKMNRDRAAKWAIEGTAALAKLKAKSALPFLKKIMA
ncbi:MAG: hypothetical protein AAFU49_12405 [Pseudomonadota bacterium]